MTLVALGCLLAVLQLPASDSLRLLAVSLPQASLVLEVRERPVAVRDAVNESLRRGELDAAGKIAAAYALAWRDSFLVREVARFAAWPAPRRAAKVAVDSMRRAGIKVFGGDGPRAAVVLWRRALARATTNGDSAGMAALLGNIGAGLLEDGQLDSARLYLERAHALATAIGDLRVSANAVGALAGVQQDRGDLAGARDYYVKSLTLRDRIGDTRGTAADHNNLGLLAQQLGDLGEARRQFDTALALNRRDGRDDVAATNLVNLAGLASLDGDFAQAERLYRDALATWRAHEEWAEAASALHGLGQLELRRGDYPAARAALRDALTVYVRTGPMAEELAVRKDLAGALAAMGELQDARDELGRAQRRADSTRAPPVARGGIALARADLPAARRQLNRAAAELKQRGDPVAAASALGERAVLEAGAGAIATADSLYRAGLEELGDRVAPEIAWRLHAGWAQVLRTQGATDAAARELRIALKELERPSQSLALAERRSAFLADKWDVYAQLALVEHDRTHPGAAFDASERLRAREMLELLRRGRVTPPADTAVDLVTREQDLRRRIAELSDEAGDGPIGDEALRGRDPTRGAGTSRETLLHTQEAYTELLLELRERAPRHVALVAPEVASWQSVARRLHTDQAFVEYLVSGSGAPGFVVTADPIASIDLGSRPGALVRPIGFARGS